MVSSPTHKHLNNLFQLSNSNSDDNFMEGLQVQDCNGKKVTLSELWEDYPVLLKVIPKMDSREARHEARALNDLQNHYPNLKIVAVVQTEINLTTFLDYSCWSWQIYMDPTKQVFRRAGISLGKSFSIKSLFNRNSQYEGAGGTFIFGVGGSVLFSFVSSRSNPFPSMKTMYGCLGGDPEEVDELSYPSHCLTHVTTSSRRYTYN